MSPDLRLRSARTSRRAARTGPVPRRTFAARRVTRTALVLLVALVALAGLWGRVGPDDVPATPSPPGSVSVEPAPTDGTG